MLHDTLKNSGLNRQKDGNVDKRRAKHQTRQDCCRVAPNPPQERKRDITSVPASPKGINSQAIDKPGHATTVVATQQLDRPYTPQSWQGGHCAAAKESKQPRTNRTG